MRAQNYQSENSAMIGAGSGLCHQPKKEPDSCFLPQLQAFSPQLIYNYPQYARHNSTTSSDHCSTLNQSSTAKEIFMNFCHSSPSNVSFSSNGSAVSQLDSFSNPYYEHQQYRSPENNATTYGSPISGSTITDGVSELKYKLIELETAMLGPDSDLIDSYESSVYQNNGAYTTASALPETNTWNQLLEVIAHRDIKTVLIACANAISDKNLILTRCLLNELRQMVSVSGVPMQRLGAYILEGLVARLASSGSSICKALRCKEPASSDLLSYMQILYEVCPYIKFGYMSANGAIAEATKDEDIVHIVDFQIGQGSQWVTLIQAFAARPGGPPRIRITGIDDSYSAYARGGGLGIVGQRLAKLAQSFKVPFEFHAAALTGSDVQRESLRIQPGEALAVNFAFTLHHMPDESVSTENHRDRLLRMVKSLSPKVVTLVEQECNTNSAAFFPRFVETLDYYTAMFESMDVTLARDHKDRINVEQHCLARDVVNLIACEGAERVERHELLGKWRLRFAMAGFRPCPLSSLVNRTIKGLLQNYCDKYRLEEKDGALYLGWKNRNLVASCAWQCSPEYRSDRIKVSLMLLQFPSVGFVL